jgi:hypothetical protein
VWYTIYISIRPKIVKNFYKFGEIGTTFDPPFLQAGELPCYNKKTAGFCRRPLASGKISVRSAIIALAVLFALLVFLLMALWIYGERM